MHEVYAYGVIAPSTLIEIDGRFPAEAGYAEIVGVHPSFGGEAAGGAYVLARLGVPTKLSGTRLSVDSESRRVIETLSAAGVDCGGVATDAALPMTEMVVSSDGERTVFGTYVRMLADESWAEPSREDIASSRMVCLDPFFGDASLRAARWCRDEDVPYVTIDIEPDTEIARGAHALVISQEFADRTFGSVDSTEILARYRSACPGLVILTQGGGAVLYGRPDGAIRSSPPFVIEARDTAGAGDSFRAGVIYGLLQGFSDERIVRTASAIAAMVCLTSPGVLHSPTGHELDEFLAGR